MYDTIGINIETYKAKESKIINFKSEIDLNTGDETLKGRYKNLGIKVNQRGINIIGSLAKYYFGGSNLETLGRQETQRAIEMLSDELSLNISEGRVFRADLGTNFIVKENINNYKGLLGELNHFTRSYFKESLYYLNSNKNLIFYDKYRDLKHKNIIIPDEYKQFKNKILRYECRFTHRLSKQFNTKEVKAKDLYNEDFYISALDKWKDFYLSINKLNKLKFNNMALKNIKTFESQLMILAINQLGLDEVMNMIELSRESLSRVQISRLKRKVKSLNESKALTEPYEIIKELDSKVIQAVANYR